MREKGPRGCHPQDGLASPNGPSSLLGSPMGPDTHSADTDAGGASASASSVDSGTLTAPRSPVAAPDMELLVQRAEGRVWATVSRLPPSSSIPTALRPWLPLVHAHAHAAGHLGHLRHLGLVAREGARASPPLHTVPPVTH